MVSSFVKIVLLEKRPQGAKMSNFKEAVDKVLQQEGGLSNDKNDKGGITNHGISLRFIQDVNLDVNGDGSINGKDIEYLTTQEAIDIYKKYWFDKYNFSEIKNDVLCDKIFSMAVNAGSHEAILLAQRAANYCSFSRLTEDGIIGPKTIFALNVISSDFIIKTFDNLCIKFYQDLVVSHPEYGKFLDGWINRVIELIRETTS